MINLPDLSAVAERLRIAVRVAGGPAKVAERSGIPLGTLNKYLAGKVEPGATKLWVLAEATAATVEWLLTGDEEQTAEDFVRVPLYDMRLSAGPGSWIERARIVDRIPFKRSQLQAIPGRLTISKLALFEIRGDSGGDRLPEGAMAMADTSDNGLGDGLFAFVLNDEARVKRFQVRVSDVVLSSDNPAYPPEHLAYDQLENLTIIGRIVWCGAPL